MNNITAKLRADYLSGKGIFGPFLRRHQQELEKSKLFLETMEAFVEKSEKDEIERLSVDARKLPLGEQDEYWQWNNPTHWQEVFSNRLRASFVILLCSFVEGELSEICSRVEAISRAPVGAEKLKGSAVSKPKDFLQAFGQFAQPSAEMWESIDRLFHVRNVMVHRAGFAGTYKYFQKIEELVATAPGMTLVHDHIEIDRSFCDYLLAEVGAFCAQLHNAYESFRATHEALERLAVRSEA